MKSWKRNYLKHRSLKNYSDAYILVSCDITITGNDGTQMYPKNRWHNNRWFRRFGYADV